MAFTGCRPLTVEEQQKVCDALKGKRDKALFTLQLRCGFRVSELLSLRTKDVCTQAEDAKAESKEEVRKVTMFDYISVQRKNAKKKLKGRTVPLNRTAKQLLQEWIEQAQLKPEDYLFPPWTNHHAAKLIRSRPIHYHSAWRIYKKAFAKCGIAGPAHSLGTHVCFPACVFGCCVSYTRMCRSVANASPRRCERSSAASKRCSGRWATSRSHRRSII